MADFACRASSPLTEPDRFESGSASRHDFVIVIPVADRPEQLAACLNSLLQLRRRYPYAGEVSVLIADDSREAANIVRHRASAELATHEGLPTHYLDLEQQFALIEALPVAMRARLDGVLGVQGRDSFHHKGASVTRNIAYLWLRGLPGGGRKKLYWFIDSDQEFRVEFPETAVDDGTAAGTDVIDYFHWLDRIFSETATTLLTGKVVGDPPVSPAVMANNFLEDVLAFLADMAELAPQAGCTFHARLRVGEADAAYHDMADLFGFKPAMGRWHYPCPIRTVHDHAACFSEFAAGLSRFFDGEHPTRRSFYRRDDPLHSLQAARTLYTGNYVFNDEGLAWFIPFANLRLRMAGPTLGRLLRAQLGEAFVSANLPLLHKRAAESIGQAEFRPGVERARNQVDLSGEYERQYYGDIMLFAIERLTAQGFPAISLSQEKIMLAVEESSQAMHDRYAAKQVEIDDKLAQLDRRFSDQASWWWGEARLSAACADFQAFITNMRRNFSADAPVRQRMASPDLHAQRLRDMRAAIEGYRDQCEAWRAVLATGVMARK